MLQCSRGFEREREREKEREREPSVKAVENKRKEIRKDRIGR